MTSEDKTAPGRPAKTGPVAGQKVRYVGDYETISILGQGGMGVVYKARQLSLNRLVALKMIRNAEFASEDQVRRFQNEAEAVATLDHPGIVPIYEVGTYEDQRYFSMKLVEGQGLDRRARGVLAKDPRTAARVVAEVADAVTTRTSGASSTATSSPPTSSLDGQGHAHVTDFGLAKRIEEDAGLTVSGAIMGTPSYMAPEQAAGRSSLDHDGLRRVRPGGDPLRRAHRPRAVRRRLGDEHARPGPQQPPQPPTRLNAKLPRDLEVICPEMPGKGPKAPLRLGPGAGRRPQPLAAGRADRGPAGRPGRAAPDVGETQAGDGRTLGRAHRRLDRRRDRRHLAMARGRFPAKPGPARAGRGRRQETGRREARGRSQDTVARDQAVASEKKAVAARAQAEQNAQIAGMQATLALNTIQDLVSQVQKGPQRAGPVRPQDQLLETALKRIDGVAGIYEKSTSKEATTAALMELARIYRQLGQIREGLPHRRCLEITKERVKIKNYSDPSRQNLANVYRDLAIVSEEFQRDMTASLAYNRESLKIWEDVYQNPKNDQFALDRKIVRYFLAEAYTRVAVSHYRAGEIATARDFFRKAYNLRSELVAELPEIPQPKQILTRDEMKQDLSFSIMALAETSFRLGDKTQADDSYRQALELREAAVKTKPNDPTTNDRLGAVHYMIGEFKLKRPIYSRRVGTSNGVRRSARAWPGPTPRIRCSAGPGDHVFSARKPCRSGEERQSCPGSVRGRAKDPAAPRRDRRAQRQAPPRTDADAGPRRPDRQGRRDRRPPQFRSEGRQRTPPRDRPLLLPGRAGHPPDKAERSANVPGQGGPDPLRTAVSNGFRDRVYLETEPDLDPIRNRDDFKQIVGDIRPG